MGSGVVIVASNFGDEEPCVEEEEEAVFVCDSVTNEV